MITTDNSQTLMNALVEIQRLTKERDAYKAQHAEIKRLKNEAVAADIRIENDATVIARLNSELETLSKIAGLATVERDAYKAQHDEQVALVLELAAERDELRAKLASLEGQEPVAWLLTEEIYGLDQETWEQKTVCLTKFNEDCVPLYAAACAAPTSVEWQATGHEHENDAAGAAPVTQHIFGGRVDPGYVSGPMEAKEQS